MGEHKTAASAGEIVFDETRMTVGDYEDFEEIAGQEFAEAFKPVILRDEVTGEVVYGADGKPVYGEPRPTGKALKAIVFIAKRWEDPTFTREQARDVRISELAVRKPAAAIKAGAKGRPTTPPARGASD